MSSQNSDNLEKPGNPAITLSSTPRPSTRRGRKRAGSIPSKKLFPTPSRANLLKRGNKAFSVSGKIGVRSSLNKKGITKGSAEPGIEGQLANSNKRKRMSDVEDITETEEGPAPSKLKRAPN